MNRDNLPSLALRQLNEALEKQPITLTKSDTALLYARRGYLTSDEKERYTEYFAWYEGEIEAKLAKEKEEAKTLPVNTEPTVAQIIAQRRAEKGEVVEEEAVQEEPASEEPTTEETPAEVDELEGVDLKKLSRDDLDGHAIRLGVDNPQALPNKDVVISVINAVRKAK